MEPSLSSTTHRRGFLKSALVALFGGLFAKYGMAQSPLSRDTVLATASDGTKLVFGDDGLRVMAAHSRHFMFGVDLNGNMRARTKSFDIEHPTQPQQRLIYGCLEGPENGVYVRGKMERTEYEHILKGTIPAHFGALVEDYSILVGGVSYSVVEKTDTFFTIHVADVPSAVGVLDFVVIGARKNAPLLVEP